MMDDLYADLEETDVNEELDKLRSKNQILEDEVAQLKNDLHLTTENCGVLKEENNQLKNNISTLFKTAQGEITRKDQTINELRTELENLKFRRLGTQNKHHNQNSNRCNPEIYSKTEYLVKPQSSVNKLQNPVLIKPKRVFEEQQTSLDSRYSESGQNNHEFPSDCNYEDPSPQSISRNNDCHRSILTSSTIIEVKQETDVKWHLRPVSPSLSHGEELTVAVQPENPNRQTVPKSQIDVNEELLHNHDSVKMEDLDILELDIKQEFNDDRFIPEIKENTDRKRKRCSPSPLRKISKRNTLNSDHRKYSPKKNTRRLISKSRSSESNSSRERLSQRPRNKKFHRDNDRLIDNTRISNDKQNYRSRNRDPQNEKQDYSKRSDHTNESRYINLKRQNYEYNTKECRDFENSDRRKNRRYDKRSSPSHETYRDHRNRKRNANRHSSDRFSPEVYSKANYENKNLSDITGKGRERQNDRNSHLDKSSPSVKGEKNCKPFEPLKQILNLYSDSKKDIKDIEYDKKTNDKSIIGTVKRKTLSLGEYNKRHNSMNVSSQTTALEIKKDLIPKESLKLGFVKLDNICKDVKTNLSNKVIETEDGEVLSDQEMEIIEKLKDAIDYQDNNRKPCHIAMESRYISETLPKILSQSDSQPSVERIEAACSSPNNSNESERVNKSERSVKCSLSNESKETISIHSKLIFEVATENVYNRVNNGNCFKSDNFSEVGELKPCNEENIVTNILSDKSTKKNAAKYNEENCSISVIDVNSNKCPILPSESTSVTQIDVCKDSSIKAYKIPKHKKEEHKINSSAAKSNKSPNSSNDRKNSNTANTSSKTHFNKCVPTKIKSKLIHNLPVENSCNTSEATVTKYDTSISTLQSSIIEKHLDNSKQNNQTAKDCKSTKEKSQSPPASIIESNSEILMNSLVDIGVTSQTVPQNSKVSNLLNYSKVIPTNKPSSNIHETLPIIEDTSETISKNNDELCDKVVYNSLMSDLMKMSQAGPTYYRKCDNAVPQVCPTVKDSFETIPIKNTERSNTAAFDSLMKDLVKITQMEPAHSDISLTNASEILPVNNTSLEIPDKSNDQYDNIVYNSLITNIIEISQSNTSHNKILIKDKVESQETTSKNDIVSSNKKGKDLLVNDIIEPSQTACNTKCDGKKQNNPTFSDMPVICPIISADCQYNSDVLDSTPGIEKQKVISEFQTIRTSNNKSRSKLEHASNKNVDLISGDFPIDLVQQVDKILDSNIEDKTIVTGCNESNDIELGSKISKDATNKQQLISEDIPKNLIQHVNEIQDYCNVKDKTIITDCNLASNNIVENSPIIDKVNITCTVSKNIYENENTLVNHVNTDNSLNSVGGSILPIDNHDTNTSKTVSKIMMPKAATTNSNTVHFKISRRRNVAIKSSTTK